MIHVKSFTINITKTNYVSMIWKQPSAWNVPLDEGDCHSWTKITFTSTSQFSSSVQSVTIPWLNWSFTEIQVGCVWQRYPHSMKLKCHRVRRTIQSWVNDWWTGSKLEQLAFFPKKKDHHWSLTRISPGVNTFRILRQNLAKKFDTHETEFADNA